MINLIYDKKIILIGILFVSYKYIIKRFFQPKISVFLPIYNMQDYIRNAINSIQKQTLRDIEILLFFDDDILLYSFVVDDLLYGI